MVTCSQGLMMWRNRITEQSAQRKGERKHKTLKATSTIMTTRSSKTKTKALATTATITITTTGSGGSTTQSELVNYAMLCFHSFQIQTNFACCLIYILFLLWFVCLCIFYFTVSSSAVSIENGTFTWSSRNAPVLKEWVLKVNGELPTFKGDKYPERALYVST